jgi:acyl carrier protein
MRTEDQHDDDIVRVGHGRADPVERLRFHRAIQTQESARPMDAELIYQRLTKIFHDVFDDDSIILKPATSAADIPDWDSVNHIRLVVSIEAEFRVRFTVGEIEALQNIGDLEQLLQTKA